MIFLHYQYFPQVHRLLYTSAVDCSDEHSSFIIKHINES